MICSKECGKILVPVTGMIVTGWDMPETEAEAIKRLSEMKELKDFRFAW